MEQDKIKSIFDNFQPRLATSDENFMARLERNIRAVEVVKQQLEKNQKRNRLALCMASVTGFIFGILMTLCYPAITNLVKNLLHCNFSLSSIPEIYTDTVTLALLGLIGFLISYTVYDITRIIAPKSAKA